jgi:hypothetical protein
VHQHDTHYSFYLAITRVKFWLHTSHLAQLRGTHWSECLRLTNIIPNIIYRQNLVQWGVHLHESIGGTTGHQWSHGSYRRDLRCCQLRSQEQCCQCEEARRQTCDEETSWIFLGRPNCWGEEFFWKTSYWVKGGEEAERGMREDKWSQVSKHNNSIVVWQLFCCKSFHHNNQHATL